MKRFVNACIFSIAFLVGAMFPMVAHATTINFDGIPSDDTTTVDIGIGEAQLSVVVSQVDATRVSFQFKNTGSAASAIAEIYFDDDDSAPLLKAIDSIVGSSSGVAFTDGGMNGVNPGNLPGGTNLTPDFVATKVLSTEAKNPESKNGVNPGEYVLITFDLFSSVTYDDVVKALKDGDLRMGLHVVAFTDKGSASFVNYYENGGTGPNDVGSVPEPGSLVLLGSVLLGIAGFRLKGKLGSK